MLEISDFKNQINELNEFKEGYQPANEGKIRSDIKEILNVKINPEIKNILFISEYFPPDQVGASTRISILVQELIKTYHVYVITCCPHYPAPKNAKFSFKNLITREHKKNLTIIRIWIPTFNMDSTFGRILNYSWFTFSFLLGLPYIPKPDFIWSTSPNIFCGFTARIAKRIFGCKTVANVDDIWPEAPIELGFLKPGLLRFVSKQFGIHAFDHLDGITTISDTITKFYNKKYQIKNIFTIPVGIEQTRLKEIIHISNDIKFNSNVKSENDSIIFMYSGMLGAAYDFKLLIKSFSKLNSNYNVKLIIRGSGPHKKYIERLMDYYKPPNVIFESEYLSIDQLNQKLLSADIFVLPMMNNFISKTALPTKLFEYMAFGKPVLVYSKGEPKWLVEKAKAGIACPNGGTHTFIKHIEKILKNPKDWKMWGKNGQKFIMKYYSSNQINTYTSQMINSLFLP